MAHEEVDKRAFNLGIDQLIKDFLKEEVQVVEEENKQKKYRKHFEQIIQLNSKTDKWTIRLNNYVFGHFDTKEQAEEAAEQLNFAYNLGLFEGIVQGKELQQKSDEEGLDVGLVLSIFETEI